LKSTGYDVYVSGVPAYSTLGWFNDPVLSTFINYSAPQLAALIFHELAHQRLYIDDDTVFNESFATAVELEGLRRWLDGKGNKAIYDNLIERKKRRESFIELVLKFRSLLESLYSANLSDTKKRSRKKEIYAELRSEYKRLKRDWGGNRSYDLWFDDSLNNAKMNTIFTYYDFVPAFQKLLNSVDGDLELFYRKCRTIAEMQKPDRHRTLKNQISSHR